MIIIDERFFRDLGRNKVKMVLKYIAVGLERGEVFDF